MPVALILSFLGKNWKLIGVALLALAVVGWVAGTRAEIAHLKHELAAYQTANDQLHAANQSEHATVGTLLKLNASEHAVCTAAESAADANLKIARHEAAQAQARAVQYGSLLHAIQAAPPSDDAPVSPVLRDAVDGLWNDPKDGGG